VCTQNVFPIGPTFGTGQALRRTFLGGIDEVTGKDFSHRKDWLEQRMFELCELFSVDIYAYAVMDSFLPLQKLHTSRPCE